MVNKSLKFLKKMQTGVILNLLRKPVRLAPGVGLRASGPLKRNAPVKTGAFPS